MAPNLSKFLWSVLDRVAFIGIGVIGTIATTYITGIMKLNPPELVVDVTYSRVDSSRGVPASVGGLRLDYTEDAPVSYGILRVDVGNSGRGSAEKVRLQVRFEGGVAASYNAEPDFRVYSPTVLGFEKNEFYTELAHFPAGARDFVAFRVVGDKELLRATRIKFVNDDYEGEVSPIRGLDE